MGTSGYGSEFPAVLDHKGGAEPLDHVVKAAVDVRLTVREGLAEFVADGLDGGAETGSGVGQGAETVGAADDSALELGQLNLLDLRVGLAKRFHPRR